MPPPSNRVLLSATLVLLASYLLHRASFFQLVLLAPLLAVSTVSLALVAILVLASRSGRLPEDHDVQRRRHALRPLALVPLHGSSDPSMASEKAKETSSKLQVRLNSLLTLLRTHYILPWYSRISPAPSFPDTVDDIIRHALTTAAARAEAVDWSAILVNKVVPMLTAHVQHYRSVEHMAPTGIDASFPLPLPDKAHRALSNRTAAMNAPAIEAHLRLLSDRIVDQLVPDSEKTVIVRTLVREVLLGAVLLPVFDMLCDSDFWNRQIDERGGRYLHEQKQVNKFLLALSALPQPVIGKAAAASPSSRRLPPSSISVQSSTKQFDDFMRSIPKLKTLGEARRLRADVERETRSARAARAAVGHDEGKETETKIRRLDRYLHRLDKARVSVDARIASLSGATEAPSASLQLSTGRDVTLYTVLSDPSSLAYWLEYMERRARAQLVQFWLTVEGFKDPLEAVGQHSALESVADPSAAGFESMTVNTTIVSDTAFLYQAYFAAASDAITVPAKHLQVIKEFAERDASGDTVVGSIDLRRAKHAVYAAQQAVYDQMEEEDWKDFQKSELYLKAVADLTRAPVPPPLPVRAKSLIPLPMSPPLAPPPPPPLHPTRQMTAPATPVMRRAPDAVPRRPHLLNGSIAPATSTPLAAVSTSALVLEQTRASRVVTPETRSGSLSPVPSTPRGSSALDYLIAGEEAQNAVDERSKLFDDVDEHEGADDDDFVQVQRMEAIQAALNEIIAADDMVSSRHLERLPQTPLMHGDALRSPALPPPPVRERQPPLTMSRSVEDLRAARPTALLAALRVSSAGTPAPKHIANAEPTLTRRSSLPKLSKPKHIFDDGSDEDEMDAEAFNDVDGIAHDVVQLAAPGDLQLSVEIARLADKVADLSKQDVLLDSLIRQAELTGNQRELKLLQRSQTSVRREQRTAVFQKAQFEQQDEENRLVPGRTRVMIPTSIMTDEDAHRSVVRYTVEVSQVEDGEIVVSWVVARRYNEFWDLDRAVREYAASKGRGAEARQIAELPPKRLVTNMAASFVDARRIGLEKYLQSLLAINVCCESPALRAFLSRSSVHISPLSGPSGAASTAPQSSLAPHVLVKSLYKTMASSLDDALLAPSMLDVLSQSLGRQISDVAGGLGLGMTDDSLASLVKAGWSAPGATAGALAGAAASTALDAAVTAVANRATTTAVSMGADKAIASGMQAMGGESATGAFTAPICDLFIEVFGLKENNWLRRQAIVIILQQIMGGTIERKVRDSIRTCTSADSVERTLAGLQEMMWPGGQQRPRNPPRTDEAKAETSIEASKKLGLLIPDVAANMIGRGNARRAARRVFGALQDRRLNQHLVLSIMDEVSIDLQYELDVADAEIFGAILQPPMR